MVNVKQSAGAPRHVIAWPRVLMALSLGLGVVIRLRQFAAGRSLWLDEAALGLNICLLYTSPSPRDRTRSRMPSSA